MAETLSFTDRLVRAAEAIPQNGGGPAAALRLAGLEHARALGLPTRRTEAWKYTPIERILARDWRLRALPAAVTAADVEAIIVPGLDATRVVLDAGRFRADLSDPAGLPEGVYVGSLYEAPRAVLEAHLGRYARQDRELFSALNAALLTDGVLVYVPRGVVVERPILILSMVRTGEAPFVAPRVLVVAEDGAQVQVIEQAARVGDGEAFFAPLTEVSAGQNARVVHYRLQHAGMEAYEVSNLEVYQRRGSVCSAFTLTLSGATVRNNARVVLDGEGAESHLRGFFLGDGTMHVDNATEMDHAQPHCTSNELYKGILDGRSKGVFNGRVLVRPGAQKTNAYQSSRAVVLSEGAEMNSKPELEIYADDVKCSHGAATGRLDEAALFYLRQRGLNPSQARALLLLAFAREVTDTIEIPALHDWLDARLQDRFHTS